jgi:hypothetical protein
MAVRLNKPWIALSDTSVAALAGHLGVYQLANAAGDIVYIGVADARTAFGLRGELAAMCRNPPASATQFRIEVTMSYRTRHLELLQVYLYDHGGLPVANTDIDPAGLGRLRPG